tara:strand:- start:329 stop:1237 length:909 start_codon:yes stop_codon:yes gene_type:complete
MLKYENIAIGATLSSVLYSFYTQTPLIFVKGAKMHPFDFYNSDVDLSLLKIDPKSYFLKQPDNKQIVFGPPKQQVYDKLLALLSLSGLAPFSHLAKSININDDYLRIITEGNKSIDVEYDQLIVFDDNKINGLPHLLENDTNKPTQILDWFEVNLGSTHDVDYIETDSDFVKRIFFYSSQRDYTQTDKKDLLAISYLTTEDATHNYQYSDTYAKFKILQCIKEAGIRGPKNGKNPNYPDRSSEPFKWLSPKISLMRRQVMPLPMGKYEDSEKIKFSYETSEEIISNNQVEMDTYTAKLLNAL